MLDKVRCRASVFATFVFYLLISVSTSYAQEPGTVTTVLNLDHGATDVARFAVWSVDNAGNVYCLDRSRGLVLRVSPLGEVHTIAGNGTVGNLADFGLGRLATSVSIDPGWVAVDHSSGDVVVALVTATGPVNARISPDGLIRSFPFDLEDPFAAEVFSLDALGSTWDENANSYHLLSDARIVRISPEAEIATIATVPPDVAFDAAIGSFGRDAAGNFYITARIISDDEDRFEILRLAPDGSIAPVAGGGEIPVDAVLGPAPALAVAFAKPPAFVVSPDGTLYQGDSDFVSQVVRIDTDGTYNIIAGTGAPGYAGDGGPAILAQFDAPYPIGIDAEGALYVWDAGNYSIRKIVAASSNFAMGSAFAFRLADRGGIGLSTTGGQGDTTTGYARIRNETSSDSLAGIAIFTFRSNGVVVSEASVPASIPVQSGRVYAEVNSSVNTGIAIANPGNEMAVISFYYTNSEGVDFGQGVTTLPAHGQMSRFLSEAPFNSGTLSGSTFTFTSSADVSAVALRGVRNERGEFLMTTVPIASLAPRSGNVTFPHFVDGGGWTTQIVLVNPTDSSIGGSFQFIGPGGASDAGPSHNYIIPSRGARVFRTSGTSPTTATGSVRVTPNSGSVAPSGLLVFSLTTGGVLVTEAGVPADREGAAFRIYIQEARGNGAVGSVSTGVAVTNESTSQNMVNFELTDLYGEPMGISAWKTLSPHGQYAGFINELFPSLPASFSGILRITGADGPVTVTALRSRINERSDFLITTMPSWNEAAPVTNTDQFFPHIVDGGGWSTQFMLFGGSHGSVNRQLTFIDQSGNPLELQIGERK